LKNTHRRLQACDLRLHRSIRAGQRRDGRPQAVAGSREIGDCRKQTTQLRLSACLLRLDGVDSSSQRLDFGGNSTGVGQGSRRQRPQQQRMQPDDAT